MWIKINNDTEAEFVRVEKILDYNQIINITKREINSATGTLILYGGHQKITCKNHKGDYQEWLDMLKLSKQAINTPAEGY